MKNAGIKFAGVALIASSLLFITCKKKETPAPAEPEPTETGQSSTDNRDAQSENDAAVNDINTVIGDQSKMRGRSSGPADSQGILATPCGMSVDTSSASSGSLTCTFTGTTCLNRTRTGTIKLSIKDYAQGMRWKKAGAVLVIQFINYKVVRASDQKSIMLNGTQELTNVSGGSWWEFLVVKTQTSVVHSVSGYSMNVTFSDGKTAIYNINRKITYTLPGGVFTVKGEGTGSFAGLSSLENYGTTRDGDAFTSQVSTPIVWNLSCGAGAPVSGDVNVAVTGKNFGLRCLFGVDAQGNVVTPAPNACAYGWKLEWTYNGESRNKVFGYN
jgi:hypothetical protein